MLAVSEQTAAMYGGREDQNTHGTEAVNIAFSDNYANLHIYYMQSHIYYA